MAGNFDPKGVKKVASDEAILAKLGRGESLTPNEQARYARLAKEGSQRGSNIRAWEKGNRKSPS